MGSVILETLKDKGEETIVIDFDPNRIKLLIEEGEYCIYGDATDNEIVDNLDVKKAKLVISTIDKYEESLAVVENYKKINSKIEIIVTAQDTEEAKDLYKAGADLVIVPTLISGDYLVHIIDRIRKKNTSIEELKKKELKKLA